MAFTLGAGPVNAVKNDAGTAVVSVVLPSTTAGRSIVVGCWWHDNTSTITSITCTSESNLTVHGSPSTMGSGPTSWQMASLANITTSGSKTITLTLSANSQFMGIFAVEFAGGYVGDFFDVEGGSSGNDTSPITSLTTSAAGDLIVGGITKVTGATTAGTGYTGYALGPLVYIDVAEYDLDVGAAGSIDVTFSTASGGNNNWLVKAAAFKVNPGIIAYEETGSGGVSVTGSGTVEIITVSVTEVVGSGTVAILGRGPYTEISSVISQPAVGATSDSFNTFVQLAFTKQPSQGSVTPPSTSTGCLMKDTVITIGNGGSYTQPGTHPVVVTAWDANNTAVETFQSAIVTISLSTNPVSASLGGTTSENSVTGVTTFDDLTLDTAGNGFQLTASCPDQLSTTASRLFSCADTFVLTVVQIGAAYGYILGSGGSIAPDSFLEGTITNLTVTATETILIVSGIHAQDAFSIMAILDESGAGGYATFIPSQSDSYSTAGGNTEWTWGGYTAGLVWGASAPGIYTVGLI